LAGQGRGVFAGIAAQEERSDLTKFGQRFFLIEGEEELSLGKKSRLIAVGQKGIWKQGRRHMNGFCVWGQMPKEGGRTAEGRG
jgi:ribosomal protein S13